MSCTSRRVVRKCSMKSRERKESQQLEEFIMFTDVVKSWLNRRRSKKLITNDTEMAETIKCAEFYKQELSQTKELLLQENSLTPQFKVDINRLIKGCVTIINQMKPNKTDLPNPELHDELQPPSESQSICDVDLNSFELNKLTDERFPITPNKRNQLNESDMDIETNDNCPERQLKTNSTLQIDQQDSQAIEVTLRQYTSFVQSPLCSNKISSLPQVVATKSIDYCNFEKQDTMAFLQTQYYSLPIQQDTIPCEPLRPLSVHENDTQQDSGIMLENIQSFDLFQTTNIEGNESTDSVDNIQEKLDNMFQKAIDVKQKLDDDDMQILSSALEMLGTISSNIVAELGKSRQPLKKINPFELEVTGFELGSTDFYPVEKLTEKPSKRKIEEDLNCHKVIRRYYH